jgi:carbon monoxide dehydrogenase subunit G
MATIEQEITVSAKPEAVWEVIRDVGALHTRLVPGFVVNTKLEPGARIVTFGNGMTAREAIVSLDDKAMRLVWSANGGRLSHHNASVQIFPAGDGRSRVRWIADLLPDEMREPIAGMISEGMKVMQGTLDKLGK